VLDIVRILGSGGDLHEVWPDVQVPVALAAAALLTVGVGAAGWAVATRWMAAYPARDGYARPSRFADLLPGKVGTAKARRLRACLSARRPAHNDLGVPLGRFRRRGPRLRASWEDVVLAICAPRSGKTTCLAVPPILDAPGPVLVTSNKTDVWTLTSTLRATDTGQRTWTFDPKQITRTEQAFAWDALAGVATVADARRLAGHFIQEIRRHADAGDFWDRDAEDLLTGLLLAAALKGAGLGQVGSWLTAVSSVEPRNVLTRAGFTQLAEVMAGRSQARSRPAKASTPPPVPPQPVSPTPRSWPGSRPTPDSTSSTQRSQTWACSTPSSNVGLVRASPHAMAARAPR
jgi:hypothetical protein